MQINREAQFCDPDGGLPPPRPRSRWDTLWMLAAIHKAQREHEDHFGSPPHTVYLEREDYRRLLEELAFWSNTLTLLPPITVEGMLVLCEPP